MKTFAELLREARLETGKEVEEVASEASISPSYWYQLERAEKDNPSVKVLMQIAAAVNKRVDYFMADAAVQV